MNTGLDRLLLLPDELDQHRADAGVRVGHFDRGDLRRGTGQTGQMGHKSDGGREYGNDGEPNIGHNGIK